MAMTIAALGRAAGVGVETVRYYQRRGLLPVPDGAGSIRRYDDSDLRKLHFIRRAAAAGFSLAEIGELIRLDATNDRARAAEMAGVRLAALDDRIAELEAARASLGKLRRACTGGKAGPCPILEAFDPD
ncbi:MerR family transcriptional regulator [Sphingomonas rhizophila]|uniref:MerR family transcriptional regulator n=1 Tax=Sphingomonas rhizophila TaxID=2071607 RepID=A0A7G9SAD9_9SPHN|nr:MerR family transcriptional regulator [Sphingomonas rhizophila]QNN64814.1 MerR family transcriptional regulator [Sphingomonas rhizophila]